MELLGSLLPVILGAGTLGAVVLLLQFANTRKETKTKSGAEAYDVYSKFVTGALTQAHEVNAQQAIRIGTLGSSKGLLIDLVLDLITFAHSLGATREQTEPFHDRLDAARDQ